MKATFLGRAAALSLVFLTSAVMAQSMSVSPSASLPAGGTATVTYQNIGLANTSVAITVSGGFPVVQTQTIIIELDAGGRGIGTWTVSSTWRNASFNGPSVPQINIPIS